MGNQQGTHAQGASGSPLPGTHSAQGSPAKGKDEGLPKFGGMQPRRNKNKQRQPQMSPAATPTSSPSKGSRPNLFDEPPADSPVLKRIEPVNGFDSFMMY